LSLTITADLKDLTGSTNAGYAVFTLGGYGANVPRVSGAIISQVSLTAQANGAGAISQAVTGNDVITPAGTFYIVEIFSSVGGYISIAKYIFTGSGTVDLSTLTPL
jgi:hypothetical protein